jgi:hypothetical protein
MLYNNHLVQPHDFMKLFFVLAAFFPLAAQAAIFYPIAGITAPNSTAFYAVTNLIQGPGVGFSTTSPHDAVPPTSSSTWVTNNPFGSGDYYSNLTIVPAPILIIDLGANRVLTEISTWGYASGNTNGVRTFNLRFATDTEGPGLFGNSIPNQTGFIADFSPTTRDINLLLATVGARYIEFTATDNWRGLQPPFAGGDRVGLGEIAFAAPEPSKAMLAIFGFIPFLRRRRA